VAFFYNFSAEWVRRQNQAGVLAYPQFSLSEDEIQYLLYEEVPPCAEMVAVRPAPVLITEDPADGVFLRCAHAGRARYILKGRLMFYLLDRE
jgi:hypothetical protein